jgi:hypothetical protein
LPKVLLGEGSRRCYRDSKPMDSSAKKIGMGQAFQQRFGEHQKWRQ